MLSKEQIDKLKELAAKATKTEWSDDGWNGVCAASDQLNGGYFVCTCEGPDRRNNMDYISAANPAVVLELIAMLESAQKDAARYHKWRKETAQDNGYSEDYIDQTLDAAMQRHKAG